MLAVRGGRQTERDQSELPLASQRRKGPEVINRSPICPAAQDLEAPHCGASCFSGWRACAVRARGERTGAWPDGC